MSNLEQLKAARDVYEKLAAAADVLEKHDNLEKQLENMEARAGSLGAELDQRQAKLSELKAACTETEENLRQLEKDAAERADALSKRSVAIEAECEERIKDANARALGAMTEATQAEGRLRDLNQQVEDRKAQLARLVNA